jgi:SAM-dependent methyltransferase
MKALPLRYYDPKENRLIYIGREATPALWDEMWSIEINSLKKLHQNKNKSVLKTIARYIQPGDGVILEGGCGNGAVVSSLKQTGYEVIGIDFAPETVSILNAGMPELDIRLGDVRNLPLKNSSVMGYVSLGVIEHFYEGFGDIAQEMARVIQPGGYLFLTYPYMSLLRRAKAALGLYPLYQSPNKPQGFYQFALDHTYVTEKLESFGFKICFFKKANGLSGFNEEIPFPLTQALIVNNSRGILLRSIRYILNKAFSPFASHVCLMVFRLSDAKQI